MSPNRLEPTTTSNQSGCCTKCAHRMSMWNWSVRISGYDLAHQREALVPVRHGEGDAVRLGRRCQMLLRPRHRQFEGEFQDAVDAVAAEHALLRDELALGVDEHPSADRGVLALGVLAHHVEVDVGLGAAGERRAHARHQLARPQIHILVEAAADRDQQAPQRDVVRHVGPADRAEQDRSPTAPGAPCRPPASSRRSSCRSRTTSRSARTRVPKPKRREAASSTFSASGTVSLPMPSPGTTAILCVFAMDYLLRRGSVISDRRSVR